MRNKKAKSLRRLAESMTIGQSEKNTKRQYKKLKQVYKQSIGQI
jgi:hypothetical protein